MAGRIVTIVVESNLDVFVCGYRRLLATGMEYYFIS